MDDARWQAEQFERNRAHLRSAARRMLGSEAEAEDAVQEAWLRLNRSEATAVENVRGWLTTVVSRICLDMLRARQRRREELVDAWELEPIATLAADDDPEAEALMADTVGLALNVVLETLSPAERLAFVLHDMFGVPFEDIAPIVDRTVVATRQLASRARRIVRGAREPQAGDFGRQRNLVEAFLAASRDGDFDGLLAVLDPDVTFRADAGESGLQVPPEVQGAQAVATVVLARGAPFAPHGRPALVGGRPGAIVSIRGQVVSIVRFSTVDDRITELNLLVDPDRLRHVRV